MSEKEFPKPAVSKGSEKKNGKISRAEQNAALRKVGGIGNGWEIDPKNMFEIRKTPLAGEEKKTRLDEIIEKDKK